MTDKSLYDMTQDEALEYLRGLEGIQNIGTITQTGGTNEYDPYFYKDASGRDVGVYGGSPGGYAPLGEAGYMEIPRDPNYVEGGMYTRGLTPMFDPNYAGGVYGHYEGIYDDKGKLLDVQFRKGERSEGFLSDNLETIGPLVVAGAMGLGGGLFSGLGGTEAAAGTGAGASGAGSTFGTGLSTEVLTGSAGADTLATGAATGGTGAGTGAGLSALDAAAAYDAALAGAGTSGVASQAYSAAIAAGMSAEQAAMAAQVAAGLEGSGMATSAMVSSGLEAAGAAGATGAVGAGGSIVGGGGAITAGLTGAAGGAGGLNLLSSAKEFLKSLGIKDLKTGLQMGLLGAGLVQMLGAKSGTGGGAGASGMQLRTPMTYSRTRNPQAKYATAADARAYMQGQPGTSSGQQRYFNQGFTKGDMYDARTGETYVKDPNTGRLISKTALDEASKQAGLASGGLAALAAGGGVDGHLGSYSDGGRLLRGPGDGVSDSIPATIGGSQPARLADGEFVVPARIVSELGNGSTEAGARKLYQMMDRIQRGRRKTVGKNAVAKDSKAEKHLPA